MIGTSVDRYEILEELGHGGMSVVYRGIDTSLEREVAVKILHNHLAKKIENRKRFQREAKAIARLRHSNILEVYDFSAEDADRAYIVMEYVAGQNLRQFIGEHGNPPPEVAALIGIEICEALSHAHDHGVIHRDLKPENVMVSRQGEVKLMDFGIAHVIDAETMTQTGSLLGSPAHMAPEIIEGEKVDVRADVFALGTVLYWLSTGTLPFDGRNAPQVLKKVLAGEFQDPEVVEPRIGRELASVITQCLSYDREDRYPSVHSVSAALFEFAARIGLEEPELELKRYFNAPARYTEKFETEIVDKLIPVARRAHAAGDSATAIGLYNRILTYDPNNAEVQNYLESLCRRERTPKIAFAAVIAVAGLAGVIWFALADDVSDQPARRVEERPTVDVSAVTPTVHESVDRARAVSDAEREGAGVAADVSERAPLIAERNKPEERFVASVNEPKVKPVAKRLRSDEGEATATDANDKADEDGKADTPEEAETPRKFKYRFRVIPAAATLYVDGKAVDPLQARNPGVELTAGRHVIKANGQCCKPLRRVVHVDGPQDDVAPVTLHWDSGRVKVISNTRALVWLEGSENPTIIDRAGRNSTFSFEFGRADRTAREKQITLTVAPHGRDIRSNRQTQKVRVRPGQTSQVTFNFGPE